MLGFLDLLGRNGLTYDQRDCLETAKICGKETLVMLDGLVAAAGGGGREARDWHDLKPYLESVVGASAAQAKLKALRLVVRVADEVPRWWYFDGLRLGQVLANVLGNAVKFTESGVIVLTAEQTSEEDLEIRVCDTGGGIAAEQIPRLLKPFERGESCEARDGSGFGLGLAIVQMLVSGMGGTMRIRSEAGSGTEVGFVFPWPSAAEAVKER